MVTKRRRIWDHIKRAGPVGATDIAEALGMRPRSVSCHLWYMRQWCEIQKVGNGSATVYLIEPTARYACPGSGTSIGSAMARQKWNWKEGMAAIHSKRKGSIFPAPATALEQCWGLPMKRRQPCETLDIQRGEACPEQCEAA